MIFAAITSGLSYRGFSRWELWFGNSNKAAALLALLALIALHFSLRSRRRIPATLGFVLTSAFGFSLLHTFSRGGVIAFLAGSVCLIWTERRSLGRLRGAWLGVAAALLSVVALHLGVATRMADGISVSDASARNRLVLWQSVPAMLKAAPSGWGLGGAGQAYEGWFQPLEDHEKYRTLVSSHLTWLVEFGVVGRVAYCAGWMFVIFAGMRIARREGNGLPLALWICLGVAGTFSSVLEAWELWVLPLAALCWMVGARVQYLSSLDSARDCGVSVGRDVLVLIGAGTAAIAMLATAVASVRDAVPLRIAANGVCLVGEIHPERWIVRAGEAYSVPRTLRRRARDELPFACGVSRELSSVPSDVRVLAVCGEHAKALLKELPRFLRLGKVVLVSPGKINLREYRKLIPATIAVEVLYGALDRSRPRRNRPDWVHIEPAANTVLKDWPELLFETNAGLTPRP